jgi:hypothetical protein
MSWYDLFVTSSQLEGSDFEKQLNTAKRDFLRYFNFTPNRYTITDVDGKEYEVVLQKMKYGEPSGDENYLLSKLTDSFNIGFTYQWDDVYWMITNEEHRTIQSHNAYKVTMCNNTLSLYDENSILNNIPCVVLDKYTFKLDETKYVTLSANESLIMVSNNATTQLITENDIYPLGRNKFEVVGIDDISKPGVFLIKLQTTVKETEPIPSPTPTQPINITGSDYIIKGKTSEYTTDYQGTVVFSLNGDYATIQSQDGSKSVLLASQTIGEVTLTAQSEDGSVSGSKTISIEGYF